MTTTRRRVLAFLGGALAAPVILRATPAAAAAGIARVGAPIALVKGQSGHTFEPYVAARPNGAMFAVWNLDQGETFRPICCRPYAASLKPVSVNRVLAKTNYPSGPDYASIVPLPDGGVNVFFSGWLPEPDERIDIRWLQRFAPNMTPRGKPILIDEGLDGEKFFAVRLDGGSIMTAWRGYGSSNNHAKVVTAAGATVAENKGGVADGSIGALAATAGGGAVVAFAGSDYLVTFQRLSATGARVGRPITVPESEPYRGYALDRHRKGFAAAWRAEDAQGNPTLAGGIYSAAGAKLASFPAQRLGNGDLYRDTAIVVKSLADGRVLVATETRSYDYVKNTQVNALRCWLFGEDGTRLATADVIRTGLSLSRSPEAMRPHSITQFPDGSVVIGYTGGPESGIRVAKVVKLAVT